MKDFCVIGSGISGSTIASILNKKHSVDVYDKARGAGGRATNKNLLTMKILIMEFNIFLQKTLNLKNL